MPPLRLAIVNRFAPPDAAPTGLAAARLAQALRARMPETTITLVASSAPYHHRPGITVPEGVRVVRVPSWYAGRHPVGRGLAWLWESRALAKRAAQEGDVVITLTDPPLLPFWVNRLTQRTGQRWVQWCMDLYPETLAAAGVVREEGALFRWLTAADARVHPDFLLCLGAGQGARLAARHPGVPVQMLPAGLLEAPESAEKGLSAPRTPLTLVYAGNLGALHDPEALAALIEAAPPERFRFLLAPYGSGAARLRHRLAHHVGVVWRDHLASAELAAADVHLVSLTEEAGTCCVPAKAVSAVCLGRPILFLGGACADVWTLLGEVGWRIAPRTDPAALTLVLEAIGTPVLRQKKTAAAIRVAARLRMIERNALAALTAFLERE